MSETLTKSAARNIFYGGTVFFFVVFIALVAHSVRTANAIAETNPITPGVAAGKRVWERHACFDCHTLMGEGARYAPELKDVWTRYGGDKDPASAREGLKAWIKNQPSGVEDRHQMPHFDLTEQQLDQLVDFLQWNSKVNTQNWPPRPRG